VTASGIGSAVIVATPLILATYALMASVIAGRGTIDLSVGPLIGFINVTLVQLNGMEIISNPFAVFGYAMLAGAAYQFLFALVVIYVRVQPIIVSLSGYLALSGLNLVILPRPGGLAPEWMANWGAGTTVYSPVLLMLVLATLGWLLFTRTAFYTHLRLMGSDERAAYTAGVPITAVRIGAHLLSGVFAGLAAIAFTALISSGDPSQGTTYTLIAVTALVLGGASLGGGRASVFGSALGAINLYLITFVLATFSFGAVQSFVTDLVYGSILVGSLLLTLILPVIQRYLRDFSPLLYFVVLGALVLGVILHATHDYPETTLPPTAVEQAAPGPLDITTAFSGTFEIAQTTQNTEALRAAAFPYITGTVILAALAILTRVAFTQSRVRDHIGPVVYLVVAALMLLVAYNILQENRESPTVPADRSEAAG
jgi:ribose transport system permease protein